LGIEVLAILPEVLVTELARQVKEEEIERQKIAALHAGSRAIG